MVLLHSIKIPRVSMYSGTPYAVDKIRLRGFHPLRPAFPKQFCFSSNVQRWGPLPRTYCYIHSLDRSTKSTISHIYSALSACKHRVSGSFSLPSRGSFQHSITVLFTIGHQVVFRLGGWSPRLPTGLHVSGGTLDTAMSKTFSLTGLLPTMVCLPIHFC